LHGKPVVLALSGIGKVAAATTATVLIELFASQRIVFTGVAGGVGDGVQVGDVVVAQRLCAARHGCVAPVPALAGAWLPGQTRFPAMLNSRRSWRRQCATA
jgi:nucleoside phosphorylase